MRTPHLAAPDRLAAAVSSARHLARPRLARPFAQFPVRLVARFRARSLAQSLAQSLARPTALAGPEPPPDRRALGAALAAALALLVVAGVPGGAVPAGAHAAATSTAVGSTAVGSTAPGHATPGRTAIGSPTSASAPPGSTLRGDVAAVEPAAYRSPTSAPPRVLRHFVGPPQPWAAGHRGVDLELDEGATVVAPAAGTVVVAGPIVDRGVVTVQHPDGRRSSLEPVTASVVVGQEVTGGDPVGTLSGERSHCADACLHWGVREGTTYVDPLALLPGGGPIVLLPDR